MRRLALGLVLLVVGTLTGVQPAHAASIGSDRWALLIGIDHFEGKTRSNVGAVGDVRITQDALIRSGWQADHIKTLTESGARADDIRAGLRWLADHSSEGGFSVMSYSGHVKQVGSTEYLWPHDNRFIADSELAASLRQVKGRLWANISGCEAAGFDEGISGPNRLFTASSQSNEKSYEYPEAANSIFHWLLVERGLIGGEADANRDRRVSIQEAFRFAADRAPGMTTGQSHGPQHPQIAGASGGDWFLGAVETAPSAPPPPPCFFIFCLFAQ